MKQQFNVNLDAELVRRVKHHSIDVQQSLSDLLTGILTTYLEEPTAVTNDKPTPDLTLQPIVHVTDLRGTLAVLEQALGARLENGSRDGDWVLVSVGGAQVGLLAHPPNPEQGEGQVELSFASATPLEEVEAAAAEAGVEIAAPTADEGFGRQLQLRTPDGLLIKVNDLEPDLYR